MLITAAETKVFKSFIAAANKWPKKSVIAFLITPKYGYQYRLQKSSIGQAVELLCWSIFFFF